MTLRLPRAVTVAVRVALGFGLLTYVLEAAVGRAGLERLLANAWVLVGFVVQSLVGASVESKRLGLLLRSQLVRLPFLNGYRLVTIGKFFSFAIPGGTGGDLIKLYYLASENRSRGIEIGTVVLADRVVGLVSMLAVAVVLALASGAVTGPITPIRWLVGAALATMAGVVAATALSWSDRVRGSRPFRYLTTRAPMHRQWDRVANVLNAFRHDKRAMATAVALSTVGQVVLAGMFLAAGRLLLPGSPALLVAALSLLGLVANALPVTPGGLGVGEAAFYGLFALAGYAGGAQLALAWRVGQLPMAVAGGLVYVVGLRRSGGRITGSVPAPQL